MKKIISILLITGAIFLVACNSNVKPQGTTTPAGITQQLKKGSMTSYDFGAMKMHVYQTRDFMNDYCIVLEKKGKGVIIESPAFRFNYSEFINYLTQKNIQVKAIIPSYHPLGATFIKEKVLVGIGVYLTKSTLNYFSTGFGLVLKQKIKAGFGDKIDAKFYEPTVIAKEGENEIAGIKMIFKNTYDGFDIEIPEISTVYVHILGHDVHSEILSREHLRQSIKNLETYTAKGYQTFLSSHYKQENRQNAITKIAYLKKMQTILGKSKKAKEFIQKMKAAYPNYKIGYLLPSANALFMKKK